MDSFRWIWRQVRSSRGVLILSIVALVLDQTSQVMTQGSQKFLIDDILIGKHYEKLKWVLLYVAATYSASYVFNWWGNYMTRRNGWELYQVMGRRLMAVIQRMPMERIQASRTGKWVQYFTSDLQNVTSFITSTLPKGLQQIAGMLLLVGVVGWTSPVVLAIVAVFSALYIGIGRIYMPIMRRQTRTMQEKRGEMLVKIEEGIASTREVVAYNRMEWEERSFRSAFQHYYEKVMENGKLTNSQTLLSNSVQWIGRIAVLVVGGYSVIRGQVSLGMFVIVYQYSTQLFGSFQAVYNFAMNLSSQMAYVDRVQELFEAEAMPSGGKRLEGRLRSLAFEGVAFAYPGAERLVLNGLHVDIPLGRKVAIVGPSGGGKSTITQLLLRFFEPSEGCIRVNGGPLPGWDAEDWMSRVSIVFQEPFLLQDTIRTNLLLGREDITEARMIEACRAAQIHEFILGLEHGYDTAIGERGYTLSGGQRQRIAIARALLGDPELLILDEATSALDIETERRLQEKVDDLRKGRTTLIIAHRLSTVRNADLILVMAHGRLVEQGTHAELMGRGGVYRELVASTRDMEAV